MSPVERPTRDRVHVFATQGQLRAWFAAHHDTLDEAFIGFHRKGVTKPSVTYAQIVEEALCFGWIDGVTFRIDDEVSANRYTPRRPTSNWSAINIAKIAELTAAGRMQPAGRRAFEERDRRRDAIYSYEQPPADLPPDLLARLQADAAAWAAWQAAAPSYRHAAAHWITSAARAETRERRFAELLASSAAGARPRNFRERRVARSGSLSQRG